MPHEKFLSQGLLIAFEGIDGAGKTTSALLLRERLRREGYEVIYLKEPTDGKWGQRIKEITKGLKPRPSPEEELHLFLRDRMEDVEQNIQPALKDRKIVIMDRYYFSTMAYQGALGLHVEEIRRLNETFAPKPTLVFILRLAPRIALSRIMNGRKEKTTIFEREDYLMDVQRVYDGFREPYIQSIESIYSVEIVSQTIVSSALDIVKPFLVEPS